LGFSGNNAYQAAVVPFVISNVTIDCCENRPVASDADAITGVKTGSELAHDDVSGFHELPISALDAAVLWV